MLLSPRERLQERARRELADDSFVFLPLRPSRQGYIVTQDYCFDLTGATSDYVNGRRSSIDHGVCTVMLLRPEEKDVFRHHFSLFSVYGSVHSGETTVPSGAQGRRNANREISRVFGHSRKLLPAVRAVNSELTTRMRRTPLLLPLRHFGNKELRNLIEDISENLTSQSDRDGYIRSRCTEFERAYPFQKTGKGGRFQSGSGVVFNAPGRALHGHFSRSESGSHQPLCELTARARLGGRIQNGFHYDCSRSQGEYSGVFENCHGASSNYVGRPHLNVYPNDFIRV